MGLEETEAGAECPNGPGAEDEGQIVALTCHYYKGFYICTMHSDRKCRVAVHLFR